MLPKTIYAWFILPLLLSCSLKKQKWRARLHVRYLMGALGRSFDITLLAKQWMGCSQGLYRAHREGRKAISAPGAWLLIMWSFTALSGDGLRSRPSGPLLSRSGYNQPNQRSIWLGFSLKTVLAKVIVGQRNSVYSRHMHEASRYIGYYQ